MSTPETGVNVLTKPDDQLDVRSYVISVEPLIGITGDEGDGVGLVGAVSVVGDGVAYLSESPPTTPFSSKASPMTETKAGGHGTD